MVVAAAVRLALAVSLASAVAMDRLEENRQNQRSYFLLRKTVLIS